MSKISAYNERNNENEASGKFGRSQKMFAAKPILSESVPEGTKVGFLDKHDFILYFHKLQRGI